MCAARLSLTTSPCAVRGTHGSWRRVHRGSPAKHHEAPSGATGTTVWRSSAVSAGVSFRSSGVVVRETSLLLSALDALRICKPSHMGFGAPLQETFSSSRREQSLHSSAQYSNAVFEPHADAQRGARQESQTLDGLGHNRFKLPCVTSCCFQSLLRFVLSWPSECVYLCVLHGRVLLEHALFQPFIAPRSVVFHFSAQRFDFT